MPPGQPTKYKPEYCELILSPGYDGLFIEQIAKKLGVAKSSLYEWAKKHPQFSDALTRARENCIDKLLETGFDNLVVHDKNTKLHEKTLSEYLRFAGLGRRCKKLEGVENEHEALQIIQDSASSGEIIAEHAESLSKVIMAKLEARKVLDMAKDIDEIKHSLGLDL